MSNTKTIFSGIQPTGQLHLGNYLGAIQNWVKLQDQYNCIYSIVDYHAITIDQDPKQMQAKILEIASLLLACGIDPKKSILFIQSHIPEHTELAWIFNTLTPIAELERMTQFKDKADRNKQNINAGLFTYPVLQAADILIYKADAVPVGEDQLQHVELTRKIVRKFNNKYGEYFTEPEAIASSAKRVMSLTEPESKMSKSHGEKSYIALTDSAEVIRQKISKAVTDSSPDGTMSAGVANLFNLLKYIETDKAILKDLEAQYKSGTLKYSELKNVLAEQIIKMLEPIQTRYQAYISDPQKVWAILADGQKRAETIAKQNMAEIKKLVGLL
ncbi:MAG: tryptophan--tRNA ligase [Patescibacteria group bacterium]